ncbi:MAG: hypothetical protein WD513_07855 [Balneolaceae bacterium]
MKRTFHHLIVSRLILIVAIFLTFAACSGQSEETSEGQEGASSGDNYSNMQPESADNDSIVQVIATYNPTENRHLFEISNDEIFSGWTTFRFSNASPSDHFFLIFKAPEEAIAAADAANEPLLDHWYNSVTAPFQEEYNPYVIGDIEYGEFVDNLVASIIEKGPWFFDPGAPAMGGPGFTSAGKTSETTVNLTTGQYIVECYVKDENEIFHSYIGMLEHLTVTDEESEKSEPQDEYYAEYFIN